MKKLLAVLLAVSLVFAFGACADTTSQGDTPQIPTEKPAEPAYVTAANVDMEKLNVVIETQFGDIHVALNPEVAPITVTNFQKLVGEGFYDGLTFHRVIDGFMIQGGASQTKKAECIKGEFTANGVENPLLHKRGVISMARTDEPNSANSQFFIMHADAEHLDGQYAAFGQVTEGIEVVDEIVMRSPIEDSNGTVATKNQIKINRIYFK